VSKKRVREADQRCKFCRECSDPQLHSTHNFQPYHEEGQTYGSGPRIRKNTTGCPRYDEGLEYFEDKKQKWLDNHRKTSRSYFVPPPSTNKRGAYVPVCRSTFITIFSLGEGGILVDNLANRDHSKPIILDASKREAVCGRKSLYDTEVAEHLASFKRITSHYSNSSKQDKAKHFEDPELCPAQLWRFFLDIHDPEFAAQARRYSYWHSYDRREPPDLPEGEVWIRPALAHSSYSYKLSKYDLGFGKLSVDTCPCCDMKMQAIAAESDPAKKAVLEAELDAHKKEADCYYCAHKADEAQTDIDFKGWVRDPEAQFCSFKGSETQCQDAAGNLRTPRLTVGELTHKAVKLTALRWVLSPCALLHSTALCSRTQHVCCLTQRHPHKGMPCVLSVCSLTQHSAVFSVAHNNALAPRSSCALSLCSVTRHYPVLSHTALALHSAAGEAY
jgi:hypothetical protein